MLKAMGVRLGSRADRHIADHGFEGYVDQSKDLLARFRDKILDSLGHAFEESASVGSCRSGRCLWKKHLLDIGEATIALYEKEIAGAGTVFVNGPLGCMKIAFSRKGHDGSLTQCSMRKHIL
jgi:phosphoglycerate kinase